MNLSQIRTRVQEHLGEPVVSSGWFTPTAVNGWINAAIEAIFLKIITVNPDYFGTKTTQLSYAQDVQEYALSIVPFEIRRVEVTDQGSDYFLGETDIENKNRYYSSSEPSDYYIYMDYSGADPALKIGLVPMPGRTATNNVTVYYVPRPRTLTADTDTPDLPLEHHELAAVWAAIIGLRSDQRPTGELQSEFNFRLATLLGLATRGRAGGPSYIHFIND